MSRTFVALAVAPTLARGPAAEEGHRLSGTLTHAAVDDGVPAYFKLIGAEQSCMDPGPGLYAGQASFSGGEAPYALDGVAAGKYMVCFFIDSDDNVMETQGPTSGDYGAMKAVTVDGETSLDVTEAEWGRIP
jgi:hypothetical protein